MDSMRLPKWGQWAARVFLGVALLFTGACGPGNSPPEITTVAANPASIGLGGSSTIGCIATDPDGDTLTYDWTATSGTISGEGDTITWIAPNEKGIYAVRVIVADGKGGIAEESCSVAVGVATGWINVTSTPGGANVYLDGEDTGMVTPCNIADLTQGGYTMKLTYYHYKDEVGTVTVNAGLITYIDWTLTYAYETPFTIQPGPPTGNDAYVYEDSPVENYGSEPRLFAGAAVMDERYRSYLQFDFSAIPSTAVIINAELGLYYDGTSGAVPTLIGVYRVISSWDEDDIDWWDQPAWTATPESTVSVPADVTNDFIYWDIGELVQGWVDGSIDNKGVLLKDTDESIVKAWKRFYSSSQTVHIEQCPKLSIVYFDPT